MFGAVDRHDLGVAIGIARVVDEARRRTKQSRVDDVVVVDTEHVAADALKSTRRMTSRDLRTMWVNAGLTLLS